MVCSTPGAVSEAPGDPVSSRCPECELDIINETVERTEHGKKTEREAESSGITQRAACQLHVLTPGKN